MSVTVAYMTHQLARRCKRAVTMFATMWLSPRVSVDVVLQRCQRLKPTITNAAFVGPFFRMAFHMPRQQISFWTGVVAVITHMCLRNGLSYLFHSTFTHPWFNFLIFRSTFCTATFFSFIKIIYSQILVPISFFISF